MPAFPAVNHNAPIEKKEKDNNQRLDRIDSDRIWPQLRKQTNRSSPTHEFCRSRPQITGSNHQKNHDNQIDW